MNEPKWETIESASTHSIKTDKMIIPEGTLYRCYFAFRDDSGVALIFVPKLERKS